MKALKVLIWLELRSASLWSILLLVSVILWHFAFAAVNRLNLGAPHEYLAAMAGFIAAANLLGLAANAFFLFRSWQSIRNGELQFKLASSLHPAVIVMAQFLVAFVSIALYSFVVTSLGWWHLGQMGLSAPFSSVWSLWLYVQASFFAPAIALGFLVTSYSSAFHLRNLAWLALLFGLFGFAKLIELFFRILERFAYTLLSIPLPELKLKGQVFSLDVYGVEKAVLPQESIWLAVIMTVLCIYLAGRVLKEVEL
jgi:hypothetical protein